MTRPIGGASSGPSRVTPQETPASAKKTQEPAEAPAPKKKNTASETQYESAFDAKPKPAPKGTAGVAGGKAAAGPAEPKLSEATRKVLEQQLALHPKGSAAQKTLNALAASPGFTGLKEAEQQKLLRYVGGTNTDVSTPARGGLETLMGKDGFKKATAAKQTEQLRKFLTEQPASPGVVDTPKDAFKDKRLPYKLHGPKDVKSHDFRGGKADAVKYEVEVDGKKIPVFLPKKPDAKAGEIHSIDEVAKGLAALPASSRALVKQVVVEAKQNPDDAYWAKQYKDPNFRSYMTAGADGIINVYPSKPKMTQDYLDGTLIHETGHTLSMKKWGSDDTDKRWNDWKNAVKSDGIIPSQYGKASVGEDFAETLVIYHQNKGTPRDAELRALMPERYKIIDELLAGKR
ncbi:MAG TPA: hypothetical protein VE153_17480 [Myxococcus sp.]|nr:hypothetical protein [Myxococcus sp.]